MLKLTPWIKCCPMTSDSDTSYPGAQFLLRAEEDLRNYNNWIVDTFVTALAHRQPRAVKSMLDFGCGIGTLSHLFIQKTGVRPDGVEIDAMQRRISTERGCRTFDSLAQAEPEYDAIFTSNVLEHIEDDVAVLVELRQHLAKGGLLMIYVPAFPMLWTRMDNKVGHVRRYTHSQMTHHLELAGYQVISIRYCDSIGFFAALAFRLLGGSADEPSSKALRFFDRFLVPASKVLDRLLCQVVGKNIFALARPSVTPSRAGK